MPKYTIDGTTLSDVADAVRELDGDSSAMTPAQMATRIRAVQPGADLSVIAEDYDSTATYDVGDYCIHDGGLYVCTTAISTAEAWTAGHWEEVTVGDELTDLKGSLNELESSIKSDLSDLSDAVDDKYEKPSTGIPASDLAQGVIPEAPVTDVQVNGTSVLGQDGVANIPKASSSILGIVRGGITGIGINNDGQLFLSSASEGFIKSGTNSSAPISPNNQHISAFYGLAKVAGDSTQSASSNALGTYTEEAKIAIQKMLGIYEAPWEIIRSDTFTNTESADYTIEVDNNGESFELTDLYLEVWLDALPDDSAVHGSYGRVDIFYDNSNYSPVYFNGITISVGSYRQGAYALLKKEKGAVYKINTAYTTMGTDRIGLASTGRVDQNRALMMMIDVTWKKVRITSIKGIVHYILYGKRKWS